MSHSTAIKIYIYATRYSDYHAIIRKCEVIYFLYISLLSLSSNSKREFRKKKKKKKRKLNPLPYPLRFREQSRNRYFLDERIGTSPHPRTRVPARPPLRHIKFTLLRHPGIQPCIIFSSILFPSSLSLSRNRERTRITPFWKGRETCLG